LSFSLQLVLSIGFEVGASPTAGVQTFHFFSNSKIGFRSIHFVGEAAALFLRSTPTTGSFIFHEDSKE
jgi:hypothetical protein